jgi:hypothetical protein
MSLDVLSPRTFCLRSFCPAGRFVSVDVLSHIREVSGCYVGGRFVPPDVLAPDVLSWHCCVPWAHAYTGRYMLKHMDTKPLACVDTFGN